MVRQVPQVRDDTRRDPDIRVVVISGAGDNSVISGADVEILRRPADPDAAALRVAAAKFAVKGNVP